MNSYDKTRIVIVKISVRLVLGQVYCPLNKKLAVKNPLDNRISGARTNRSVSAKNVCQARRD